MGFNSTFKGLKETCRQVNATLRWKLTEVLIKISELQDKGRTQDIPNNKCIHSHTVLTIPIHLPFRAETMITSVLFESGHLAGCWAK